MSPARKETTLLGRRHWRYRRSSVARSAGTVSLAVMASRVLGLLRDTVFAFFFGASNTFANDAFLMAFRIPNLLRDLFAEGALSSALVTVFSDYLVKKDEREAFRLSNLIVNALILMLGVVVVLGVIFAPQVVSIFASGFKSDPQKFGTDCPAHSNNDAFHSSGCAGGSGNGSSKR